MDALNNHQVEEKRKGMSKSVDLRVFRNELFGVIRTIVIDDEPYFVGRDVAIALGYSDPVAAISQHVENEDKAKHPIPDSQGFTQNTTIINESGFYSLVFGSKLPLAKEFKKWVTSDVLPSIRKTGGYIHTTDEDTPDMILAKAIKIAEAKIESQKKAIQSLKCDNEVLVEKNKELAPKAKYTDDVLMSESTYTMTQVAKEFGMAANAFSTFLERKKIIFRQSGMWMLFAKYDDKGYSAVRTKTIDHGRGSILTSSYLVWTEKGRMFLHTKFDKELNTNNQLEMFG